MPKFAFRLHTLLKLREGERDRRRGELAQAYEAQRIIDERLQEFDNELKQLKVQYGQATAPGALDVDRLVDAQRYEAIVRAERAAVEMQRTLLVAEVEKRRAALVAADREVRVLEKLRETQQERHHLQEQRLEVKNLDEVAARVKVEDVS